MLCNVFVSSIKRGTLLKAEILFISLATQSLIYRLPHNKHLVVWVFFFFFYFYYAFSIALRTERKTNYALKDYLHSVLCVFESHIYVGLTHNEWKMLRK